MRPGRDYCEPEPGILLVSVLARRPETALAIVPRLESEFGSLDLGSFWLPFVHSDYYAAEMGGGLGRFLLFFARPFPREGLVAAKRFTDRLERETAVAAGRRLNLDPGCLALEHLVLATTKPVPHRPYLGSGIYADLTLIFERGAYRPLKWTYPDYAGQEIRDLLGQVRKKILRLRRTRRWR